MKNGEKENEQEKENHIKQREKTQNVQSFQKKEQEDAAAAKANAPTLGGDFLKAFISATPILREISALSSPEAQAARQDQSGFWPELGLNEGYAATRPSEKFGPALAKTILPGLAPFVGLGSEESKQARQDQTGFFPELGLSEALQVSKPWYDYSQNGG